MTLNKLFAIVCEKDAETEMRSAYQTLRLLRGWITEVDSRAENVIAGLSATIRLLGCEIEWRNFDSAKDEAIDKPRQLT